jgi:hypothetical protein
MYKVKHQEDNSIMAYISPTGQKAPVNLFGSPTTTGGTTPTSSNLGTTPTGTNSLPSNATEWHKALLWFLGAVVMLAIAGPAPTIATMILVILIVGTVLTNWKDYKMFLGMK